MTTADDLKGQAIIDLWPDPIAIDGDFRQRGKNIDGRQGLRRRLDFRRTGERPGRQPVEKISLQSQRLIGGRGDFAFQIRQLRGRKTHGVGHCLPMDEGFMAKEPFAMRLRNFNEISQKIIVFYLELTRLRQIAITGLKGGDDAAAFVAQGANFVQTSVIRRPNELAVAPLER